LISDFEKTMLSYRVGRIKLEYPRDEGVILVLNLDPAEYRISEITIQENTKETALVVINPE